MMRAGGGGGIAVVTWANIGLAATAGTGALRLVSDFGEYGSLLQSNGTRWRAVNGQTVLKSLASTVSAITASEVNVLQATLPAGTWQVGDEIRVRVSATKSGAVDTAVVNLRLGTLGTLSDTALTGASALSFMAGSSRTFGGEFAFRLISTTTAQRIGNTASNISGIAGNGTSASPAVATISDTSSTALFLTIGIASGGATDTIAVNAADITLNTP